MSRLGALEGAARTPRATTPARGDNAVVRAVGQVPVTVRTKLLVAFAVIAALLVAVGVLGLRVLGQSNARVVSLGTLQRRAATYQTLQTQAQQLRQMLGLRTAEDPSLNTYLSGSISGVRGSSNWTLVDKTIAAALSQLGPATNEARFGFTPPPGDKRLLDRIRLDYGRFTHAVRRIVASDLAGTTSTRVQPLLTEAINADTDLTALTDQLATSTRAQTDALIAQNRAAYRSSRNLFIGVGAASVLLALLLGLVLSWSVVSPIRRTEARLAEIAAGDFSRHVEVSNRDELGALAANLNRMNDELQRLYDELEAVSRHKSEFLATMSHELRTPLNAIIGFSDLLQLQSFGELNERQLGYVEDVLDSGRHLLSLINDILDLSKIEAGKMELDLSDVSLRSALESGVTMHAERAVKAGVELALDFEWDDVTFRADERKLRQVVFNLLSNAVKFTPAGGRVGVSAHVADGVVEVAVRDTGPGIAPEELELIFEEFRQSRGGSHARQEGTGLGLPLSRRFVELHGGRLWVESVRGEGSVFRFTLPLEPAR
jgi:signal transduction histidine kinase